MTSIAAGQGSGEVSLIVLAIGAGSLLCEKLSGHKVEIGLVPFGSIGLSLFGIDLAQLVQGFVEAKGTDEPELELVETVDAGGDGTEPG